MCSPAGRQCDVHGWVAACGKERETQEMRQRESVDSNSRQIYRPTVVYVHTKLNEVCSKHKPVSLPNQLSSPSARRNTQRATGGRKGNKLGSNHRKSREWTRCSLQSITHTAFWTNDVADVQAGWLQINESICNLGCKGSWSNAHQHSRMEAVTKVTKYTICFNADRLLEETEHFLLT